MEDNFEAKKDLSENETKSETSIGEKKPTKSPLKLIIPIVAVVLVAIVVAVLLLLPKDEDKPSDKEPTSSDEGKDDGGNDIEDDNKEDNTDGDNNNTEGDEGENNNNEGDNNNTEGGGDENLPLTYSEGLDFVSNHDGTCYVSSLGKCTDSVVVIPPMSPAGDKVVEIRTLQGENIREIVIPEGVLTIYSSAFYSKNNANLEKISVPNSLIEIHNNSISLDYSLQLNEYGGAYYLGNDTNPYVAMMSLVSSDITAVEMHPDAKVIANNLFSLTNSLESFKVSDSLVKLSSGHSKFLSAVFTKYENCYYIGSQSNPYAVLFKACDNTGSYYTIHPDTKFIAPNAFIGCENLKKITIPAGVEVIGRCAFERCGKLGSVTFEGDVKSIDEYAFIHCTSLKSIVLPEGLSEISTSVFSDCASLESITIGPNVRKIGGHAFSDCKSLKSITLPEATFFIDVLAFDNCVSLQTINITESIKFINDRAFENCNKLQFTEYDNAYYLGSESNPHYALIKAKNLSITSCEVNPYTKLIAGSAFYKCEKLESIEIPDGVEFIGESAFNLCLSLKSIKLPSGIDKIHGGLFYNCPKLQSLVIPDGVIFIGEYAFYGCTGLKDMVIPESLLYVDKYGFDSCGLQNVKYKGSELQWSEIYVCYGNKAMTNAYIIYDYVS